MSDEDPKVIYLAPECCKDGDMGRMWSEDGANDCECEPQCKPVKYVRADIQPPHIGRAMAMTHCQDCERENPVWFAPSPLWNLVMGGPDAKDDPGGFICPNCFIKRAEAAGLTPTAWVYSPNNSLPRSDLSWQTKK